MKSMKPRKQRKELYNAPLHVKRNWISSHLEENLLLKYDKRAVPVVKGDTIRVMRGSFKGHEDKVVKIDVKRSFLEIEGITMSKADGNKIAKPIHPSNVIITKLNLTDKWRRKKLERGLSEETKKEIEKEAEKQIKEVEEEEKRKEEEAKKLEEEKEASEIEEEETEKIEKPKELDKKEQKLPPKPKPKKEEKEKPKDLDKKEQKLPPIPKPKKKTSTAKKSSTKDNKSPDKKTQKKPPKKTSTNKEDNK
jgi:large subunit ribosomal protein L24